MSQTQLLNLEDRDGVTARELAKAYHVSPSTIWRLKLARKIPYFQPGGTGGVVRFPPNAFELLQSSDSSTKIENETNATDINTGEPIVQKKPDRLAGPQPKWIKQKTSLRSSVDAQGVVIKNQS